MFTFIFGFYMYLGAATFFAYMVFDDYVNSRPRGVEFILFLLSGLGALLYGIKVHTLM